LYDWVADPVSLFESGESQLALDIWDFNPSEMTPQAHLSKEEVDAIFTYVDTPIVLVEESKDPSVPIAEKGHSSTIEEKLIITIIIVILIAALLVTSGAKKALGEYRNSDNEEVGSSD